MHDSYIEAIEIEFDRFSKIRVNEHQENIASVFEQRIIFFIPRVFTTSNFLLDSQSVDQSILFSNDFNDKTHAAARS